MRRKTLEALARVRSFVGSRNRVPGALKTLARARILVGGGNQVPAAKTEAVTLVGTGTRIVPTVYEKLRDQRRRRRIAMILWITVPTSLASFYYGLIASNRYVADVQMVLSNQSESGLGALAGAGGGKSVLSMLGIGNTDQTAEHFIVANYLVSSEAMNAVDKAIGLKTMWSSGSIDFASRLSADASQERFLKYYQRHVTVDSDPLEPVIEVQIAAFSPRDAQLIGRTLTELAQDKLETAYDGMRKDSLRFAEAEVRKGEARLAQANAELKVFRDAHTELDPSASAKGVGTVAMTLFGQLEAAETELRAMRSYQRDDAPGVKTLKARIEALRAQIAQDRGIMAGTSNEQPYSSVLSTYEDLVLKQKFAQETYALALANLTSKRADLEHRHAYLIDFISPTLPQEATEPHSLRNVALVFIACVLSWLTGSLLLSALREHARQ